MKKYLKIILISLLLILCSFSILSVKIGIYYKEQVEYSKLVENIEDEEEYYNEDKNSVYSKLYQLIIPRLLINDVYTKDGKVRFVKFDPNNSYVIPEIVAEKADVLMGYGVGPHLFLENKFGELYKKPAYCFDCGVKYDEIKNQITEKNCHFYSECIGTDKFLLTIEKDPAYGKDQISSGKIHSFGQKIKELNLENKKIFVKMDITGAEFEVLPDILKYSDNITGISFVLHLDFSKNNAEAIKLLKMFEKDFILVSRNNVYMPKNTKPTNRKYVKGILRDYIALSYVNKNLVEKSYMPLNQGSITDYEFIGKEYDDEYNYVPYSNISPVVVLAEKLNKFLKIDYE